MIWSSRARNRWFCPLPRRAFGRIESLPPADERRNHGARRQAVCNITARHCAKPGQTDDFRVHEMPQNQGVSATFTGDLRIAASTRKVIRQA
jgi:hypothetical protein